jgi:hypothetical protein
MRQKPGELGYQTDENHNLIRSNHILTSPLQRTELTAIRCESCKHSRQHSSGAIGRVTDRQTGEMATVMQRSFPVTGVVTMVSQ